MRPFLKWLGGKYRLCDRIQKILPEGRVLVEPFVGSGAIFLNIDYPRYVLNDANPDLISLYKCVQNNCKEFILESRKLFTDNNNSKDKYYNLRELFNSSDDQLLRSILFLYLNRHGYNGLCRYNLSGGFNVPYGRYKKPYFPQKEIEFFSERAAKARFVCMDFRKFLQRLRYKEPVVYCDPPYVPLSNTANFTNYSSSGFGYQDQLDLVELSGKIVGKGGSVILSNHNNKITRELYKDAKITEFRVRRTVSCNSQKRDHVPELLALFD